MEVATAVSIGALLASGAAYYWRNSSKLAQRRVYTSHLVLAAAVYVLFALRAPSRNWLLLEVAGFLGYSAISLYGLKRSPMWLAYGWAGHVLWDAVLHWNETTTTFVPHWYAPLCIGYDLVMAGYLGYIFVDYPN